MIALLNQFPSPVVALAGFILTISFLVFIHEYGHFWMARRFGVKIEKFSIGFGRPIVKWYGKKDHTEYCISWIPLGGYVKMYGETTEDRPDRDVDHAKMVAADLSHDSEAIDDKFDEVRAFSGRFDDLPPFKRLLIAFAGPAVNIIFALLALWMLFIIGIPGVKPIIGSVDANAPIHPPVIVAGDMITHIEGKPVTTRYDVSKHLVDHIGDDAVTMQVIDQKHQIKTLTADLSHLTKGEELNVAEALGMRWAIDEVVNKIPAVVAVVVKGSPAEKAGLKPKDEIISIDGIAVRRWLDFSTTIRANANKTLVLMVLRHGEVIDLKLTPEVNPKSQTKEGFAGVQIAIHAGMFDAYKTTQRFGWGEAMVKSLADNYLQAKIMLKTLWRLVTGKASVKNLGGPITIADYSGQSLKAGYVAFFHFLASISLILAVMNLLPIPVLDGGHIAFCVLEIIRRQPLSERAQDIAMRLGLVIVGSLMIFAIGLDLWRHLPFAGG